MSTPSKPLWPQPIEVIGVTGEYGSGKTIFGLTIAPGKRTKVYDTEKSSGSYQSLGFHRVSVPDEMLKLKPTGHKPKDMFEWWWKDVQGTPPGQYDVLMIDTISEIEDGLVEWVQKNPGYFGRSSGQYAKMQGLMWGDVKTLWKQILNDLSSRCQTFVFVTHMANVWSGDRPTGKRKPKGKETLMELASLFLLMERKAGADKQMPAKPSAIQLKSRLVHVSIDADGNAVMQPCLPPRIPECTPAAIRKYMDTPPDYQNLKADEQVKEEHLSAEEREMLALQKSEADRDAERMRLDRVTQMREIEEGRRRDRGDTTTVDTPASTGPSPEQLQKLLALKNKLMARPDITEDDWKSLLTPHGVHKARELTVEQAAALIETVQQILSHEPEASSEAVGETPVAQAA